jgi:hypothetical protein
MKWVETLGKRPRTGEKPLHIRFRNGLESRQTYIAVQIARWDHRGDDWDVTHVARAEG